MRYTRWVALALVTVLSTAGAESGSAQAVEVKPTVKVKRDKYVLTAEEIAERPDLSSAYDAVKLLRAQFLKTTRAKGGLGTQAEGGGYRPDVIGRPGGGPATPPPGSGSGSGEPAPSTSGVGRESTGGTSPYADATGASGNSSAVLYVDEVRQPTLEEMKNIRAEAVFEIRYLTGNQAAGRYGAGHEGGAILLQTKKLGKR
jgi:hypothetical protein